MLTDAQKKVFEELLNDKDFKGKERLKYLLWLNTVDPKYGKGDCFYVSDPGHRIYGYPIIHFKGKIKEVKAYASSQDYLYILELVIKCADGRETTTTCGVYESELTERCEDNINIVGDAKSSHADAISLSGLGV